MFCTFLVRLILSRCLKLLTYKAIYSVLDYLATPAFFITWQPLKQHVHSWKFIVTNKTKQDFFM